MNRRPIKENSRGSGAHRGCNVSVLKRLAGALREGIAKSTAFGAYNQEDNGPQIHSKNPTFIVLVMLTIYIIQQTSSRDLIIFVRRSTLFYEQRSMMTWVKIFAAVIRSLMDAFSLAPCILVSKPGMVAPKQTPPSMLCTYVPPPVYSQKPLLPE